jgi:MoaA/NifB/PqqE/SkfB family radical SAM enzyme
MASVACGVKRVGRRLRETRVFVRAMRSARHPIAAQIVVTRRCNLACAYCAEFDHTSAPVPTPVLLRRIDRLAELGTSVMTLSGGEPLLHPDADAIIARIRARGAIATLITNGFLLTRERIRRLNRAGLDYLQISIDNLVPDAVSKKSLTLLDRRLADLAALAECQVTVNSVVGASAGRAQDAYDIALRARRLGFPSTVGVVHDERGQLRPLDDEHRIVIARILQLSPSLYSFAQFAHFQRQIISGQPIFWRCRAGGRFLYVCEEGLVHYCSQQRGRPGIPLEAYSLADLAREADRPKPCAPLCTVSCVHQVAMLDRFREQPHEAVAALVAERKVSDPAFTLPMPLRFLLRAFGGPRRPGRAEQEGRAGLECRVPQSSRTSPPDGGRAALRERRA